MFANSNAAALCISSCDLETFGLAKFVIKSLYDFHHKIFANGGTCSKVVPKSGSDWNILRYHSIFFHVLLSLSL
jgi:hypothetical protein